MKTIAVCNQKGGTGKSSTVLALAYGLYGTGNKILVIDLDPQCNASYALGIDLLNVPTVYHVLKHEKPIREAIQPVRVGLNVLTGSLALAGADAEFTQTGREYMLKEALEAVGDKYDYIIIDNAPTLGIMVTNALTAADHVVIPVGAGDAFSLLGLTQLYGLIQNVQKYCNHDLKIAGLLITRYNSRTNANQIMREQVQNVADQIGTKVFNAAIRESVSIKESQILRTNLFEQSPKGNATVDYKSFIEELLNEH